MNSRERTLAVLRGEIPDRVPVCLHNFLMASYEAGIALERYLSDPEAAARAHLEAVDRYGYDCILIDLDTTMLAEAMGARRDSTPGQPGHIASPAIRSLEEAERLVPADPEKDGRIPVLVEAVRIMAERTGGDIAIRGNADQCAFSLAALLRGMQEFLVDLVTEPDHPGIRRLLEVSYASHLATHRALRRAGADFTSLGDSLSGPDVVSPALFRRFARPWQDRLVRELAAEGTFTVVHICGNTSAILDQLATLPPCGLELDSGTDPVTAKETAGRNHVLFGNIDPAGVIAHGTPDDVREATRRLMEHWKPNGRFVLNAGCAIPGTAPPANIRALIAAARDFGTY